MFYKKIYKRIVKIASDNVGIEKKSHILIREEKAVAVVYR